jgi:hypothetical protein
MAKVPDEETIIIPDYDPYNPQPYPGDNPAAIAGRR